MSDLATAIDDAWEKRDALTPRPRGPCARRWRSAGGSTAAQLASPRSADGEWHVNQWVKKAVLLSFRAQRHGAIAAARRRPWWDKVPSKFAGWGENRFRARLPRGARRDRAPLGLHRARRRPDAELRQSRRPCRRRHDGRHLGHGRLLRADRQELPHLGRRRHRRRARAAAGGPGDHRGQLLRRRALRGGRGRRRREGAVLSMGVFIGASTKIVDRATGEVHHGRVPPYSVVVPGGLPDRSQGRPHPLLRRHRQARRREDALQDVASTNCCATERVPRTCRAAAAKLACPFRRPVQLAGPDTGRHCTGAPIGMRARALFVVGHAGAAT